MLLLSILLKKPMNMRRLAIAAGLDYKTVEHHVRLMEKNSIIESMGGGYGRVFFVSELVLAQKDIVANIRGVKNGKGKNGKK
ncbi:Uncharacterised protein [Candidatus Norongarragalina meridionalis]|nr:Uncharacterised protein [Candidatus Norongarragalina meridionalis]